MKLYSTIFIFSLFFGMCHPEDAVVQSSKNFTMPVNAKDSIPPPPPLPEDKHILISPYQPLPTFSGCEHIDNRDERKKCSDKKIIAFIAKHIKYPEKARRDNIEGTVVIRFTIEKDGTLSFNEDKKKAIPRDIGGGCGEEALRIMKLMPKWTPAKKGNEAISIQFMIPVKFELEDKDENGVPIPPPPPTLPVYDKNIPRIVDSMPRFPGCEDIQNMDDRKKCSKEKTLNFISKNIKYPKIACSIEGTVVVRFIIEKDGSRSNYDVLRDPGGGTAKEALKVLKLMPKWIPGKHEGKAARVYFTMPVKFQLSY